MNVAITEVEKLGPGVWRGQSSPEELRRIGDPRRLTGLRSIVIVCQPSFETTGRLEFPLASAELLNLGAGSEVLFVDSESDSGKDHRARRVERSGLGDSGDVAFLASLSPALKPLGKALIDQVRSRFPGRLICHSSEKNNRLKFVEAPMNYWAVVPQLRDGSLRITLYGRPEDFPMSPIALKPDMGSYSAFKLTTLSQVPDAVRLISKARELKEGRRR